MKEAVLYKKEKGKIVRCLACQRKCAIDEGRVGFCLARKNIGGKLYSLLYGEITGIQADPIEKKPLYHFKPGSIVATVGSYGCNFRCKQCLNFQTTWGASEKLKMLSANRCRLTAEKKITPKEIVQEVIKAGYSGLAFSYNEPIIWTEFAADIAREFKSCLSSPPLPTPDSQPISHNSSPFSVFVTNGSWTKETIDLLTSPVDRDHPCQLIDAANIDFKGFSEETYQKMGASFGPTSPRLRRVNQIPKMAVYAQKKGIFLELTTLLIPGINDNPEELKKMTAWITKNLGPDTPWHLSRFDPDLAPDKEFQKISPTSPEQLAKAAEIAKKEGLNHIYIWPPNPQTMNDTYCPKCRKIVIKRSGWRVEEINVTNNEFCQFCHYKLNLIL